MTSKKTDAEISQFYPIVEGFANAMRSRLNGLSCERDDLISWGTVGLLNAAREYDPLNEKGASLRTYASRRIQWGIADGLRAWQRSSGKAGINACFIEDLPDPSGPAIEPRQEAELLLGRIAEAVDGLPAELRALVKQHFYLGFSVREISRLRSCSHQHTSQQLQRAIFLLQAGLLGQENRMTHGDVQVIRENVSETTSRMPRCPFCRKPIHRGELCMTVSLAGTTLKKFHANCLQKLGNALSAFAQGHQPGEP